MKIISATMNRTRMTGPKVAIIILIQVSFPNDNSPLVLVEMVVEGESPKLLRSTGSVIINKIRTFYGCCIKT